MARIGQHPARADCARHPSLAQQRDPLNRIPASAHPRGFAQRPRPAHMTTTHYVATRRHTFLADKLGQIDWALVS